MLKIITSLFFNNSKILVLISLIILAAIFAILSSYQTGLENQRHNNFINNIYLKKTLKEIVNNLEPKYKKYNHKIKSGETFDKILNSYLIDKEQIVSIKKNLLKKTNINKLNTNQKIQITIDQTNNMITEFIFQISNTEKIILSKTRESTEFNEEILTVKLEKKIIYKENIILQSLYKAATDENIPPNTIIEFARIYGFQVDFQRDIRKQDKFQMMYEVFIDKNKKIVETGEILFANLKLSGQDNSLYYYDKKGNETLIGATIYFPDLSVGTTTNEYGFYSITISKGTHNISVSYLGFSDESKIIELNDKTSLDFYLSEMSQALDEVVIQTDIEKINIKSTQMSVNKLTSKTIKQIPVVLGESDIIKSIILLPGVTSAGEGASGFNVRGGSADQNLILLDEAIVFNSSHVFGFFSVFNPDVIKDVKLFKGGIPSKYGGRLSSVLDIYQKEGNNKDFKLTGGIGLISSRILAEGPLKKEKSSFLIGGRSSYAHLFLPLIDNDNKAYFYDLNTKVNFRLNKKNNIFLLNSLFFVHIKLFIIIRYILLKYPIHYLISLFKI